MFALASFLILMTGSYCQKHLHLPVHLPAEYTVISQSHFVEELVQFEFVMRLADIDTVAAKNIAAGTDSDTDTVVELVYITVIIVRRVS